MITARLILERLDKNQDLLERREQPSRSFVNQFMKFLYMHHAQVGYTITDINGTSRSVSPGGTGSWHNFVPHLVMGAPGGGIWTPYSSYSVNTNLWAQMLPGELVGIVVGAGSTSPTPGDYRLEDRIPHGRTGKSGTKADFVNGGFETGNLNGWTIGTNDTEWNPVVSSAAWSQKVGSYFCAGRSTGSVTEGSYWYIRQDIDLTNVTHIGFTIGRLSYGASVNRWCRVYIGGNLVYYRDMSGSSEANWPLILNVQDLTGIQTFEVRHYLQSVGMTYDWTGLEGFTTYNMKQLEYGGCEVINQSYANPNGQFTIQRYFTNNSAVPITVNEVGLQSPGCYPADNTPTYAFLMARDVVPGGIALAASEILRVTYVVQITV